MIYLDNAATTACAPEVVEEMIPFFRDTFANASSIDHIPGAEARRAIDRARDEVAAMVGARSEDVIFTSGSTEANNLALSVKHRIFTTKVEHPSILDPLSARRRSDDEFMEIDSAGAVNITSLREQLSKNKAPTLVSVIATNNETGLEQDTQALAQIVSADGGLLHLDATQAVGTRLINLRRGGLSGVSVSAHKIYGPKGVGALIASLALRKAMAPILRGGGHERGFRSGTLNVPGIVGFGVAARLVSSRRLERRRHLEDLRSQFLDVLNRELGEAVSETISGAKASPHVLSVRLRGTNGRALLGMVREDVAFSLGSACATNKAEPSHVLSALGMEKLAIAETIRISFASDQTVHEVRQAAGIIARAATSLSAYSVSA
jgi:cysteine desulfurase